MKDGKGFCFISVDAYRDICFSSSLIRKGKEKENIQFYEVVMLVLLHWDFIYVKLFTR